MEELKILVVDDEIANLQKLRRTFINRYPVLTASSGGEALEIVSRNERIAVIVADQRMPDMTGVEFLRRTLDTLPHAIRIILTGFTDVEVLMDAINRCKVFRYIVKPWDPPDLLMTVERGLESYRMAIENEQYKKELIRRERMARELEIAREIQRYILPPCFPELGNFEMAAEYRPAREVGGDLYDFEWDTENGVLQIAVGDVSGKSIPAALYGAVFSGQMRALLARALAPAETLALLNSGLISRYQVSNYVAVSHLRISLRDGAARMANGGMPYPFLARDGVVSRLEVGGVPLGLLEDTRYDEESFFMARGDLILLFSDGAPDAMNPAGEIFGERRLEESLRLHSRLPIQECVQALFRDVSTFVQDAEVQDDVTLLAVRRRI